MTGSKLDKDIDLLWINFKILLYQILGHFPNLQLTCKFGSLWVFLSRAVCYKTEVLLTKAIQSRQRVVVYCDLLLNPNSSLMLRVMDSRNLLILQDLLRGGKEWFRKRTVTSKFLSPLILAAMQIDKRCQSRKVAPISFSFLYRSSVNLW